MKTPVIVTLTQHIFCVGPARGRIMRLKAQLADDHALSAASAMEYCDYLQSSGMMPDIQDISSLQPTFCMDWQGGHSRHLLQTAGGQPCRYRLGEQEETPVKHAVISDPTPARTGGESYLRFR